MEKKKNVVDTPRNGANWCDVVNVEPLPAMPTRTVLEIGTCDSDGSNFKPHAKPIERTGTYLWLGDFHL